MSNFIPNGYYIKARKIQDSEISRKPPHVREIWDWLIKECNHKDTPICKRGQCVRSYKDIQEGLSWYVGWRKEQYSKGKCETAMKVLTKLGMIATTKTTRGMIITVLNYSTYQDPKNYENHNENSTRTTREPQPDDTINNNDKNIKNEKKEEGEENPVSLDDWISYYREYATKDLDFDIDENKLKPLATKEYRYLFDNNKAKWIKSPYQDWKDLVEIDVLDKNTRLKLYKKEEEHIQHV